MAEPQRTLATGCFPWLRVATGRPLVFLRSAAALPRALTVACAFIAMATWHLLAAGSLPVAVAAGLAGFIALCFVYGSVFRRLTRSLVTTSGSAFDLLIGFFIVNTALFALTLATTLGAGGRAAVLGVVAVLLSPLWWRDEPRDAQAEATEWASLACLVVCSIAATLWTRDQQPLMHISGDQTIFTAWHDIFIHAREISAFAASHGASTISDMRMSGSPAPLYHVAGYMSAAVLTSLTGMTALTAYTSVQLPFGILLSGLAAFVLSRAVFGIWPALAAALCVVMLPDPYQQGVGIRLLGYQFTSQANPGTLYGIACVCVAWLFVFEGCRRGKLLGVACGYATLIVCLGYKAHIFVANAYPLLIFPCLFFTGIRARSRLGIAIAFTAVFVVAIELSQRIDRVPVIRLDGSGLMGYAYELLGASNPRGLRSFFNHVLTDDRHSRIVLGIVAAAMIALATFGPWIVIAAGTVWAQRRRWTAATIGLPILVVANYFVMALGLALDSRAIGAPEELLNRPFAWAYFVVVLWSVAGLYQLAFRQALPQRMSARFAVAVGLLLCVGGVYVEARKLQTFPAWDGYADYADFDAAPTCFVQAGRHIRSHAAADDVIQDEKNDANFMLTAVAERQAYAIDSGFGGVSPLHRARLAELAAVAKTGDDAVILSFMREKGIAWYLRHPRAAGDAAVPDRQVTFSCGGYRLLHRSSAAQP